MSAESYPDGRFHLFLWGFLATLIGVMAAAACLNWRVDPYRLFSAVDPAGPASIKIRPEANVASVKLLNAISAQPDVLILGNSRADVGFDPGNSALSALGARPYNLAVPGQSIIDQTRAFISVVERSPLRVVVVGLDFQDFIINAGASADGDEALAVDPESLRLREQAKALLTMAATRDSFLTLRLPHERYPRTLRADGFNPMLDYVGVAERSGYRVMFAQRLGETAGMYKSARLGLFPAGENDSAEFAAFRRLLRAARGHGVRVVLTTYPYHAQYLVLYRELGLWPEFERWKRLLVRTIEREAMHGHDSPTVELWDFSAYSDYSTLPISRKAEDGAGRWYWEAGHFKKELGDLMLAEMLRPDGSAAPGASLGVRLTSQSLGSWLAKQRIAADLFARDNPELIRSVRLAIERATTAQP
jgi:hypothetical protein